MHGLLGYHIVTVHQVVEQHIEYLFEHVLIQVLVKVVQVHFVEMVMLHRMNHVRLLHLVKVSVHYILIYTHVQYRSFHYFHLALAITPQASFRDPRIRITSYTLPDSMYFFEQTYSRIWV